MPPDGRMMEASDDDEWLLAVELASGVDTTASRAANFVALPAEAARALDIEAKKLGIGRGELLGRLVMHAFGSEIRPSVGGSSSKLLKNMSSPTTRSVHCQTHQCGCFDGPPAEATELVDQLASVRLNKRMRTENGMNLCTRPRRGESDGLDTGRVAPDGGVVVELRDVVDITRHQESRKGVADSDTPLALLSDDVVNLIVHFLGKGQDTMSSRRQLGRTRLVCRRLARLTAASCSPNVVLHLRTSHHQDGIRNALGEARRVVPSMGLMRDHENDEELHGLDSKLFWSMKSLTLVDNPAESGEAAAAQYVVDKGLSHLRQLESFTLNGNHSYDFDQDTEIFCRVAITRLGESASSSLLNLGLQEARLMLSASEVHQTVERFTLLQTLGLYIQCTQQVPALSFPTLKLLQSLKLSIVVAQDDARFIEISNALSGFTGTCKIHLDLIVTESSPETKLSERALMFLGTRVPGLVQLGLRDFPLTDSAWLGLSKGFSTHPSLLTLCLHQADIDHNSHLPYITRAVRQLKRLKCLHFPYFEGDTAPFFSQMTNLNSLNLMASGEDFLLDTPSVVTPRLPSTWCSPHLTSLDLSMTKTLTNARIPELSRMTSLTHLNLMGAFEKSAEGYSADCSVHSLAPLCKLTKLRVLDIRNNCEALSLRSLMDLHPLTPQLEFLGLGKFSRRTGTAGGEYDFNNILKASVVDVMRQEDGNPDMFEKAERFHEEIHELARLVPLLIAAGRHSIIRSVTQLGTAIAESLEDSSMKQDMGRVPRPIIDTEYLLVGCNGPEIMCTPPRPHETHSDYHDLEPMA